MKVYPAVSEVVATDMRGDSTEKSRPARLAVDDMRGPDSADYRRRSHAQGR